MRSLLLGLSGHIELEQHDVAVEARVVFTLLAVQALVFDGLRGAAAVEVFELHDLGADEAALEVSVDDTGSLRSLRAVTDRPALDLIFTGREVVNQVQILVANGDKTDHFVAVAIEIHEFP